MHGTAQTNLDSLWRVWEDESMDDSLRLDAIAKYAWNGYLFSNPDSAFVLSQLQFNYARKAGDKAMQASALNTQGASFFLKDQYEKAIEHYDKALGIYESIGDMGGTANALNNISGVYITIENYSSALTYMQQCYDLFKDLEDEKGIARTLCNIGVVLYSRADSAVKARNIDLANMIFDEAFYYLQTGYKHSVAVDSHHSAGSALNNMGLIYMYWSQYDSAFVYFNNSLSHRKSIGDVEGVTETLVNLSMCYHRIGNTQLSMDYGLQAMNLANEIGSQSGIRDAADLLYKGYKYFGQYDGALEMYELHITMRDSITSEENQKEIIRQEYKYEYDKQSLADSLAFAQQQELDALNHQAELDKEAQQRYALYGGLGFLLVLGGMAFRGYQRKKKDNTLITEQKKEVELQKHLVEEKNTEILDSITYAKRIQEAILPPTRLVKEWLPNSFVLYKPKDIVAGDFYWLEAIEGATIFAAADCTGHGVPGAMVSVVCHNAMNRAVREFGLTQPGAILDKTRELVIEQFEKSDEDVKDGMDIALCSLTLPPMGGAGGGLLQYAGAHNPLWIVRDCQAEPVEALNNPNVSVFRQAQDDTQCIIEIKATKQPIGKIDNPQPFTNHTIELQPNDAFYIFSDGFVDQFGGQKGKKFKAKAFRELLLSIQDRNMEEQRMLINEAFEQWRGELEQVDDVCVIGVKI